MACYLCGGSKLKVIRKKLRYGIKRNVLECYSCGLVFLQAKKDNIARYYSDGEYRKRHSPVIGKKLSSKQIFDIYSPYQRERLNAIKRILKPEMKALEVGCSAGHFLSLLNKHVDECVGIELNKTDARFVNKKLKIKAYTQPIEKTNIPLKYFDLICSFQTLEHMEDPLNFLKSIKKYLKADGFLYLEVPNVSDSLISLYGVEAYCEFMFLNPHLYYFSPKTFAMILRKAGFSGKVFSAQSYNFLNQINWILTGRPQESASIGMSDPVLVQNKLAISNQAVKEINKFIIDADKKYKAILKKHFVGDNLVFIGRKIKK